MDFQEEMPKSKRPKLKEEEDAKPLEFDFEINFRAFLSGPWHNVVVKDFEKLFHHVVNVLGAESMSDLEELQPDDLSEDKTGRTCQSLK